MNKMTKWNCVTNCKAECCGITLIPIQTYNRFKHKVKKQIIEEIKFRCHVVLMTNDISCVFLDDDCKCLIYEYRPFTCKLYGTIKELQCPYIDVYGYKRTEQDIIKTKELIKLQNKIMMDRIK